jgi:hypothetical protein
MIPGIGFLAPVSLAPTAGLQALLDSDELLHPLLAG